MRKRPCPKLILKRELILHLESAALRGAGAGVPPGFQPGPTRPVTCMSCITCPC